MPRKFYKHRLLLDEGFLLRQRVPKLNSLFDIKHITHDLGYSGLTDNKVYLLAKKLRRHIVTFNDKDFRSLVKQADEVGIIGVSANLSSNIIDKKITALLTKTGKNSLNGAFLYISGES